jgi:ribosomal-protein-alanine N-acetyltransferase
MSARPTEAPAAAAPRVRAAEEQDLGAVTAIESASFSDPWGRIVLALWLAPGGRGAAWVVSPAGEAETAPPVGYALYALAPGEVELLRVAVLPGARGRGCARRLLEVSLAALADGGRPDCHLEVRDSNRAAIRLYERLGFELSGRRRGYYPNGEDALLYRHSAPPGGG